MFKDIGSQNHMRIGPNPGDISLQLGLQQNDKHVIVDPTF